MPKWAGQSAGASAQNDRTACPAAAEPFTSSHWLDLKRLTQGLSATLALALVLGLGLTPAQAQMTVAGSLDVSPGGGANYSVPIVLPPGVGGVQPNLSFVHSSQGGGVQIGSGFGVAGLSTIARCARTPAQDGSRGPLAFDTTDRYCLDGQRLILVGGTEGANGAEYRTEIDSFSKITAYTAAGVTGGPAYFIVKTKSGLTMEYGQTTLPPSNAASGARVFAKLTSGTTDTVVLTWALNKVSDTLGNYMTFLYVNDTANGQYYISQIDYTGNASKSVSPISQVKFNYTNAGTGPTRYQSGRKVTSTVQLNDVTVLSYGVGIRKYTLSQTGSETVDKVATLTECGYTQSSGIPLCKPPLTIKSAAPGPLAGASGFVDPGLTTSANWGTPNNTWVGDFNGDGVADIASASGANVYMRFGQTSNTFTEATWSAAGVAWGGTGYSWVGDFNGDGRADIATTSGGVIYVMLSTGSGFTVNTWATGTTWGSKDLSWVGDFNGDGRTDLASIVGTNMFVRLSTGSGFTPQTWALPGGYNICAGARGWAGDFNGDGQTDITIDQYACGVLNFVTFDSAGSAFAATPWPANVPVFYNADINLTGPGPVWVADINGDGLADLIGASTFWYQGYYGDAGPLSIPCSALSTGRGIGGIGANVQCADSWDLIVSQTGSFVGDLNGDGLPDIASDYVPAPVLRMSDGKGGFLPAVTWTPNPSFYSNPNWITTYIFAGDFNGDGRTDMATLIGTNLNVRFSTYNTSSLTQTYSNGLGTGAWGAVTNTDTQVVHKPMSRALVSGEVSRSGLPSYPQVSMVSATPLVTQVISSDGVQGTRSTTYAYRDFTGEAASGRGAPLFAQTSATDSLGFTTTTNFRLDFPYKGAPSSSTRSKGGNTVSQTTNTYACIHPNPSVGALSQTPCTLGAGKRYFPYIQQSVTNNIRDITAAGAAGAFLPGSQVLNELIDGAGNTGRITTTTLNPDGSASPYSKVVENDYYNDLTNWFLGRLLKTKVTSNAP